MSRAHLGPSGWSAQLSHTAPCPPWASSARSKLVGGSRDSVGLGLPSTPAGRQAPGGLCSVGTVVWGAQRRGSHVACPVAA